MRNRVTFYTEIMDPTLIVDNAMFVGGYDVEIEEVPDAPAGPDTELKRGEASVEAGEVSDA